MNLVIKDIAKKSITINWEKDSRADSYVVYWADADTPNMQYRKMSETADTAYTLAKSTHIHHYLYVEAYQDGQLLEGAAGKAEPRSDRRENRHRHLPELAADAR